MSRLFYNSQFNGDISNWRPINLESNRDTFSNCQATVPYWGLCKNNEEIKQAINSHDLSNQLNHNLEIKDNLKSRKLKI